MSKLLELAERVERAEGPDRRLDVAIAIAVDWTYPSMMAPLRVTVAWRGEDAIDSIAEEAERPDSLLKYLPRYTASIDAAMTLVPEGWWWSAGDCSVSSDASVGPDVAHCDKALLIAFDDGIHADLPHPSTPALALCAVSLRAREALRARASQETEA